MAEVDGVPVVEDLEDFLDDFHLPEASVPICARGDLQAEFDQLAQELEVARRSPDADTLAGTSGRTRAIAERMEELRQEMKAHTRVFRFRALPQRKWSDLLAAHPARKEDAPADFNRETFPVAALAACSPRVRGWSRRGRRGHRIPCVLPVCAGMFPRAGVLAIDLSPVCRQNAIPRSAAFPLSAV